MSSSLLDQYSSVSDRLTSSALGYLRLNSLRVIFSVTRKEFKRKYPKADEVSLSDTDEYWSSNEDDIIIADYYRRVCTTRTMVHMSDGAMGYKDEMPTPPPEVTEAKSREIDEYKVEWYTIAGGNQLLETHEWKGTFIPVICTTGDDLLLDGRRVYQGLTVHARDAQTMLNFGMTHQAIHLSLTPKAPWVAPFRATEGFEQIWKDANNKPYSLLPYNDIDEQGNPIAQPHRTEPSMPDVGWANWSQTMIGMIKSTIGLYENSLGQRGQETSGRAIIAKEKQGDNATFHYVDNLSRAIALTGRVCLELIPHYYDTERLLHIVGLDGTRSAVTVNQVAPDPDNPAQAIKNNDITVGRYSVTVEAGPSYATKRQESADTLTQLAQAYPQIMQVAGDIVAHALEIHDADALAERLKLTLPPQILQSIQDKENAAMICGSGGF